MRKTNQIKVKQHSAESLNTAMPVTSITNPVSGLTIVFARIGARMVGISLAWCAPEDTFKRKKGINLATANLYDQGDFQFQVPMYGATNKQIVFQLTKMLQDQDFQEFPSWACEGIYQQNAEQ